MRTGFLRHSRLTTLVSVDLRSVWSRPRKPGEREATVLLKLLTEQTERFGKGGKNPWELTAADPQKPPKLPEGISPAPRFALELDLKRPGW